jgi:hypothetical protein
VLRRVLGLAALPAAGLPALASAAEPTTGATGRTFSGTAADGSVLGFADDHGEGVAHYGLVADLLADAQRRPGGRRVLTLLFHCAEAYLDMWRRTGA